MPNIPESSKYSKKNAPQVQNAPTHTPPLNIRRALYLYRQAAKLQTATTC